ncbi:hypothetical protein F383_10643 [Gossypium arboreum]|uniref:Uncharacterized protein n=1 Tax=Gossypium arboreum TaxID=29729 RepID=A0A0B0N3H7_GOSAR|nr:hypothetical protein F383_10643 [Gossypium arboreum]
MPKTNHLPNLDLINNVLFFQSTKDMFRFIY